VYAFLNHALYSDLLKNRVYKLNQNVLRVLNPSIIIWKQLIAMSHSTLTSYTCVL